MRDRADAGRWVTSRSLRVCVLVGVIVVLSLADLYLTLLYLRSVGMGEANPVAHLIMTHLSVEALAAWKILTVLLASVILVTLRRVRSAEVAAWGCAIGLCVLTVHWYRYSREVKGRNGERRWVANDFTVAEIKKLDAGSWRDARFAGAQVPTWDEMLARVQAHPGTGVYPELKSPPLYTARGVDMTKIFVTSIKQHGLDRPQSLRKTPVIIQSFDRPTIKRMSVELPTIPRVYLTSDEDDITEAQLKDLATFATGIAPEKALIAKHPELVTRAHALGLTVTAWTFRADEKTQYASVKDEMTQFLYTFGIDALFTNNPDQFPRR
jgi:glycerophosphoryl diester phosphodiesterase